MSWVTVVEVIAAGAVGNGVGHVQGYLMGQKVRNVSALFLSPETTPDNIWCGCGHALGFHKNKQDSCKYTAYNHAGDVVNFCGCQHFVANPDSKQAGRTVRPQAPQTGPPNKAGQSSNPLDLGK